MNNPSPLIPQGSMLEQKNKSRARVRLAVFCVLSIHVIGLMALLMQGCRRQEEAAPPDTMMNTNMDMTPMTSTNHMDAMAPDTNTYVAPAAPLPTAPAMQEYTVMKGDVLSAIARKFGVTVKQIQDANPKIDPLRLQIGQKLQIPPPATAAAPAATAADTSATGEHSYTVKSGDTLSKLATEFHTTVKAIRSANNLTTDTIKVGQKLKIPATAPTEPAPAPTAQ